MLSQETERRLARLLFQIAECERSVERSRQDICSNPHFDIYSIFRILDSKVKGKVDVNDLKFFLSQSLVASTRQNILCLIKQYDSNNDDQLSLEELQNLFLPAENPELRRDVLSRNVYPVTSYIESIVSRHLELELSYQSQLETLKKSLTSRPDFVSIDAFRVVDVDRLNFINVYEIRDFLRRNGYSITIQDLEGIIRRIDIDGDSRLCYEEFIGYLIPWKNEKTSSKSPKKSKKSILRNRSTPNSPNKSAYSSPNKSPSRQSKKVNKTLRSSLFQSVRKEDMRAVINMFIEQINLDKDIEREKIVLAKQVDFNLLDFFRLFDLNDKNFIDSADIEGLLHDLRIPYAIDEIFLLIRHFSSYRDSKIRYSDFERMYTPRDRYFAQILKEKYGREFPAYDRLRVFTFDTIDQVIRLIKLQLHSESIAESLRRSMTAKKWINLYEVFEEIDKDRDGLISLGEFQEAFKNFSEYPSVDELEALMERYDKDFDRRVSYSEFIEEITPKLL